jgi:hypothetical protein
MEIEHVSDTARWVAVYRAMETERPDAHFRDPFARCLAGEQGEAIVRVMGVLRMSLFERPYISGAEPEIFFLTVHDRNHLGVLLRLPKVTDAWLRESVLESRHLADGRGVQ